eukprot:scaffold7346_cov154-Skeletonema_menzelii.AAC.7
MPTQTQSLIQDHSSSSAMCKSLLDDPAASTSSFALDDAKEKCPPQGGHQLSYLWITASTKHLGLLKHCPWTTRQ